MSALDPFYTKTLHARRFFKNGVLLSLQNVPHFIGAGNLEYITQPCNDNWIYSFSS